jgi:peptidoglycan/xylan/chitin deacetylase (PgdA/CDA1 family)
VALGRPHPARSAARAAGYRIAVVWRLLDARVPRTQAVRRLRAVVLAGTAVLVVSGAVAAVTEPTAEGAAATPEPAPTTSQPPSTVRPLPVTPWSAPVITRVDTTDPVVFVTIDDGHTRSPALVRALRELDVPATLFLVDAPIVGGAGYFRSLPSTVVEAHTRSHRDLRGMPEDQQRAEICGNADTAERAFGRRPRLFRPPYGHYDEATQRAAAACGMAAVVLWESAIDRGRVTFRHHTELRPGDIVLLHFRPGLVADLRALVARVEAAGLRVALLEDYLATG